MPLMGKVVCDMAKSWDTSGVHRCGMWYSYDQSGLNPFDSARIQCDNLIAHRAMMDHLASGECSEIENGVYFRNTPPGVWVIIGNISGRDKKVWKRK